MLEKTRATKIKYEQKTQPWRTFMTRLYKYGLTLDQYHSIQERQDFVCAICGLDLPGFSRTKKCEIESSNLVLDHCHATDKVRGALCGSCNSGIGCFKNNIEFLQNAISYLKLRG